MLIDCPFEGEELAMMVALVARINPDDYKSNTIKSLIYKAKAETEKKG